MRVFSTIAIVLAAALAVSCAPKGAGTPQPAAVAAVVPSEIKDSAAWIAAYESLIAQYGEVAAKLNSGDISLMTKSTELGTLATAMDAVAETLKSTLSGQALTDFTAKAESLKKAFTDSASL